MEAVLRLLANFIIISGSFQKSFVFEIPNCLTCFTILRAVLPFQYFCDKMIKLMSPDLRCMTEINFRKHNVSP